MKKSLSKVLDDCLTRIGNGETIADCLADYPDLSEELIPLLDTAALVSSSPKISAPVGFRKASYRSLMGQLSPKPAPTIARPYSPSPWVAGSSHTPSIWETVINTIAGAKKVALAAMLICILIFAGTFVVYGPFRFFASGPVVVTPCTLTILSGTVVSKGPNSDVWTEMADGIVIEAGSRIKTDSNSHATLTFFDGSTIKLDPDTDITIQQVEQTEDGAPVIVLNQWLGKTWSRVIEMTIPGSQYEIHTPSAAALVRGTMFVTEVEESGLTKVKTAEGIVSVVAQDHAVDVSAGLETIVSSGIVPSEPVIISPPESKLIFEINVPAVGSVRDPMGASTGYLPGGLAFNQIPDSKSSVPGDGTQVITIPQPVTGDYMLILRAIADGTVIYSIKGESGNQIVFDKTETQQMTSGGMLVVHFNVNTENGSIGSISVLDTVPLQGKAPEKIVEVEPAIIQEKADKSKEDKDKSKDESKDNKKDDDKYEGLNPDGTTYSDNTTTDESDIKGDDEEINQIEDKDADENDQAIKKDSENNNYQDRDKSWDRDSDEDKDADDDRIDRPRKDRNWWRTWQWWRNRDRNND